MPLEFNKATDNEHEITIDSELVSAEWKSRQAIIGKEAIVVVKTAFVGDGASVKITGKTEGGAKLGKINGKMRNNAFSGKLTIPDDAEPGDMAYFEVKLSDNNVEGESNRIPVWLVEVSNMQWSAKEARRGEVLTVKANVEGVPNETQAVVIVHEYDNDGIHDKIAEINTTITDEKLELLWEYEYHEDTDELPTEEELQEYGNSYNPPEYFFTINIGDARFGNEQESGLLTFKDFFEVQLKNADGSPMAEQDCKVILPDGNEKDAKTDDDGFLRMEDVPPGKFKVEIVSDENQEESDLLTESEENDSGQEEEIPVEGIGGGGNDEEFDMNDDENADEDLHHANDEPSEVPADESESESDDQSDDEQHEESGDGSQRGYSSGYGSNSSGGGSGLSEEEEPLQG